MSKLTKSEYRKIIWGLLKDFRDDEITSLEELLEKIMAIQTPNEKGKKAADKKQSKLW